MPPPPPSRLHRIQSSTVSLLAEWRLILGKLYVICKLFVALTVDIDTRILAREKLGLTQVTPHTSMVVGRGFWITRRQINGGKAGL